MKADFSKILNYFLENEKHNIVKEIQTNKCECGNIISELDTENVCKKCGIIYKTKIIQYNDFEIPMKHKSFYNKLNYFSIFLRRIQGLSNFNRLKYEPILNYLFIKRDEITINEIHITLLINKLNLKLLRYLPDIYYWITNKIPIQIHQKTTLEFIQKYSKVVAYERRKRIKLPSSKRYFLYQFLLEYPEYDDLLKFLPSNWNNIELEKYELAFKTIFKKEPKYKFSLSSI